ncbi:MAG: transglutaminase family protein [Actinomycetota bacterium]|nr:MAG: transglutaminase family protein [Actinomycetota bacterium]
MPGRRLRVSHRTGYRYATSVAASFNEVRMTPQDGEGQVLISHELAVLPRSPVQMYVDYWGALVESFDAHTPHRELEVVSTSTVDTVSRHREAPGLSWGELAATGVIDRWCEFLTTTSYVDDAAADPDRSDLVAELRALPTPREAVDAALGAVDDRLTYTPGVTTVLTTAHEAWTVGHGVCQDFTHAALSLLRAVGIPARYVSGYLHHEDDAVGETVVGESHSWLEVWDGGWEAFDPTNRRDVAEAHVTVARGRDYNDVPPLKGIYAGGRSEALGVSVEITQLPR